MMCIKKHKLFTCIVQTVIVIAVLYVPITSYGELVNVSLGGYIGIAPDIGGELHTYKLEEIGIYNGTYDINRLAEGKTTARIHKLVGTTAGFHFSTIIAEHFLIYTGVMGTMSIWGGSGQTLDNDAALNEVNVKYSMWMVDMPLAFGLSIPFFNDGRMSIAGGFDFMYLGFKSTYDSIAGSKVDSSFSGWAFPLLLLVSGEYFFNKNTTITGTLMYYKGQTDIIRSDDNYAAIDVSGFRILFGISYYFDYKITFRKKDKSILEKL